MFSKPQSISQQRCWTVGFNSIEEGGYWQHGGKNGVFNELVTVDSKFIGMTGMDGEKKEKKITNFQLGVLT